MTPTATSNPTPRTGPGFWTVPARSAVSTPPPYGRPTSPGMSAGTPRTGRPGWPDRMSAPGRDPAPGRSWSTAVMSATCTGSSASGCGSCSTRTNPGSPTGIRTRPRWPTITPRSGLRPSPPSSSPLPTPSPTPMRRCPTTPGATGLAEQRQRVHRGVDRRLPPARRGPPRLGRRPWLVHPQIVTHPRSRRSIRSSASPTSELARPPPWPASLTVTRTRSRRRSSGSAQPGQRVEQAGVESDQDARLARFDTAVDDFRRLRRFRHGEGSVGPLMLASVSFKPRSSTSAIATGQPWAESRCASVAADDRVSADVLDWGLPGPDGRDGRVVEMVGDQVEDPVPCAGGQIVTHACDRLQTRTGDGPRGGRPSGGMDHSVSVAVDHQRRYVDLSQLGRPVTRGEDACQLPGDTVGRGIAIPADASLLPHPPSSNGNPCEEM